VFSLFVQEAFNILLAGQSIKVAIIEDQRVLREGLAFLVDSTEGFRCTGSFASVEQALTRISDDLPQVVLLDIGLPGMSGIEGIRVLRDRWPELLLITLTVYEDDQKIFDALCAGASGYLLKRTPPARLVESLKEVVNGGAPMSPEVAHRVISLFKTIRPAEPAAHGGSHARGRVGHPLDRPARRGDRRRLTQPAEFRRGARGVHVRHGLRDLGRGLPLRGVADQATHPGVLAARIRAPAAGRRTRRTPGRPDGIHARRWTDVHLPAIAAALVDAPVALLGLSARGGDHVSARVRVDSLPQRARRPLPRARTPPWCGAGHCVRVPGCGRWRRLHMSG